MNSYHLSDLSIARPSGAVTAAHHRVALSAAFTTITTFLTLLNNSFSRIKHAEAQLMGLNKQTFNRSRDGPGFPDAVSNRPQNE